MEINQKERIARHGYGINIATALKEDLEEYVETKIYKYTYKNFTDYILQLLFQEDFEGFTADNFKKIYTDIRSKLQRHLLKRGVYVGNSRVTISDQLFEVIQQEKLY